MNEQLAKQKRAGFIKAYFGFIIALGLYGITGIMRESIAKSGFDFSILSQGAPAIFGFLTFVAVIIAFYGLFLIVMSKRKKLTAKFSDEKENTTNEY